jgi:hypothetical protein
MRPDKIIRRGIGSGLLSAGGSKRCKEKGEKGQFRAIYLAHFEHESPVVSDYSRICHIAGAVAG